MFDPQEDHCGGTIPIFKKFCLAKNGGHFEFSQKLQNTKMLISQKPYEVENFKENF